MKETQKSQVIAKKKRELYQKSSQYKSAVTSDINRLKFDIERIGKNFLIIGGSLYAAYKLSKLFTGSSDEDENENEQQAVAKTKESSVIVLKIKEQITLFLLALAFKKLQEFVQERSNENDENGDPKDAE